MITAINADLSAAAAGIFTDEELAELFSTGVYDARPARVVDTRSFAERLQAVREADDRARLHAICSLQAERCECDPTILAALDAIGTDHDDHNFDAAAFRMSALIERDLTDRRAAYAERTRETGGRVWDLLPPDTSPRAGDEVEDEGVWRPRQVIADFRTRYDRAVFTRLEAQRVFDADPNDAARTRLREAWQRQSEAWRASDDETVQERDRIDNWRAGDGRDTYNAARRAVRANPNADLSAMSEEDKAAHKRELGRLRKQRSREAKLAEALAGADLLPEVCQGGFEGDGVQMAA